MANPGRTELGDEQFPLRDPASRVGVHRHGLSMRAASRLELVHSQLAAQNRTNGQIAHDLYVTSKTVEWHLGNVFRKLQVSNRSELAALRDTD